MNPLIPQSLRKLGARLARPYSGEFQRELAEARAGNIVIDVRQGGLRARSFGDLEAEGRPVDAYDLRQLQRNGAAHTPAATELLKALAPKHLRPLAQEPALGPSHSVLPNEELRLPNLTLGEDA